MDVVPNPPVLSELCLQLATVSAEKTSPSTADASATAEVLHGRLAQQVLGHKGNKCGYFRRRMPACRPEDVESTNILQIVIQHADKRPPTKLLPDGELWQTGKPEALLGKIDLWLKRARDGGHGKNKLGIGAL